MKRFFYLALIYFWSTHLLAVDLVITGKNIVTMDPAQPSVEAVAIDNGKIVSVGSFELVKEMLANDETRIIKLGNRALLPGFIDAHGHMSGVGTFMEMENLSSPPVGSVVRMEDLIARLRFRILSQQIPPGEWVFGYGYDDSLIEEGRHPNRDDLDKVSTEHPIALVHVSGHLMAANSAALAAKNITAETEDPDGGVIRRRPNSTEPNGVLEETAAFTMREPMARYTTPDAMKAAIRKSAQLHASFGITTAQDGGTDPNTIRIFKEAAEEEAFPIDIVAFAFGARMREDDLDQITAEKYSNGFRVGGVKLMLDGSPQGRTAYLSEPYTEGPPGADPDYRAYPVTTQSEYNSRITRLIDNGTPVLTHANGDGAIDMMITGVEAALEGKIMPDHRTVIIHAQLMREDQLHEVKKLGLVPSYYAAHPFFWGDWHRSSFGEERAAFISPVARTAELGIPHTIHNDAPVVPPNMMRLVWIAVNRETRSGFVLGPDQRASTMQALHAITLGAAYQYFEEDVKGSITPGKQADLVILSGNPLKVPPENLDHLQVIETFSRGRSVFKR